MLSEEKLFTFKPERKGYLLRYHDNSPTTWLKRISAKDVGWKKSKAMFFFKSHYSSCEVSRSSVISLERHSDHPTPAKSFHVWRKVGRACFWFLEKHRISSQFLLPFRLFFSSSFHIWDKHLYIPLFVAERHAVTFQRFTHRCHLHVRCVWRCREWKNRVFHRLQRLLSSSSIFIR